MKKILLILTSMLLSVMLSACSTNVDKMQGTYKLTEIQVDDLTVKKGDKLWNLTYGEDGGMIIELKGNGEGVLRMIGSEDESFEYTIDGEKIIMTNEGDVVDGIIKNNEIQLRNWDSQLLVFEKND
ncbi:MAG: hypothetical protein Q4E31_01165 [Intestinibacter bartlettii]|uniref:hypothetical protein n=1 Tax=Intestinibacter bartlettii TaxID=261299 RepID=UPI0026F004EF|nr:hypothetical protein [Intestinibacter bartlettii]MDO5009409.1 hypothetical protein [Intestinibacter bartlettii]